MEKLIPPDKFPFPFEPYEIQKDFMQALYKCIENKQVGIFESPTGITLKQSNIAARHQQFYALKCVNVSSIQTNKCILTLLCTQFLQTFSRATCQFLMNQF